MKIRKITILFAGTVLAASMMLNGCGKTVEEEPQETVEEEAQEAVEEEAQEETQEEAAEETKEEGTGEVLGDAASIDKTYSYYTEEGSAPTIGFDLVKQSYKDLVELYNSVDILYHQDYVPQDDNIEAILTDIETQIDGFAELGEEDLPDDESRTAAIKGMSDVADTLQETIAAIQQVTEEHAITDDDYEVIGNNFDVMRNLYNTLVEYFNQDGVLMTQWQSDTMDQAAFEIDDLVKEDVSSYTDNEQIREYNNRILAVIDSLDKVWDSI